MDLIDITITGGVLGITEKRCADAGSLGPETRRSLIAALGTQSTAPVPSTDDPVRDGRVVTVAMAGGEASFREHLAPPFWPVLRSVSRPGGG